MAQVEYRIVYEDGRTCLRKWTSRSDARYVADLAKANWYLHPDWYHRPIGIVRVQAK